MRLQVKGKNVEVSPSIRSYAEEKLGKLRGSSPTPTKVELELRSRRTRRSPRATSPRRRSGRRARPCAHARRPRHEGAIDQLVDKLERQVKPLPGEAPRRRARRDTATPAAARPERGGAADRQGEAVPVKPMTPEEAVLQLELIGHDFFVFRNAVERGQRRLPARRRRLRQIEPP